jgi:hypothetical protein
MLAKLKSSLKKESAMLVDSKHEAFTDLRSLLKSS